MFFIENIPAVNKRYRLLYKNLIITILNAHEISVGAGLVPAQTGHPQGVPLQATRQTMNEDQPSAHPTNQPMSILPR